MRHAEGMSSARLDTIARAASAEFEVKGSRFLARTIPLASLDELAPVVRATRSAHHGARHVCSGAVAGVHGEYSRSNDDGEPAGTAGAPILAAISGAALSDVAVLVVRWFGGTLLGTGGLARAYGASARAAIEASGRVRFLPATHCCAQIDVARAPRLDHALRGLGIVPRVDYGAGRASLDFTASSGDAPQALAVLAESGAVLVSSEATWTTATAP